MQDFVPRKFMERRNIEHVKLSDAEIMALMLLKMQYHVPTWAAFYDLVQATIPSLPLLEYSRLIRRINQITPVFQAIRRGLLTWTTPSQTAIIDSYPLPLCQGVRNARMLELACLLGLLTLAITLRNSCTSIVSKFT